MSVELVSLRYELQFQLDSVARVTERHRAKEQSTEWLEGVARGLEVAINLINERQEEEKCVLNSHQSK